MPRPCMKHDVQDSFCRVQSIDRHACSRRAWDVNIKPTIHQRPQIKSTANASVYMDFRKQKCTGGGIQECMINVFRVQLSVKRFPCLELSGHLQQPLFLTAVPFDPGPTRHLDFCCNFAVDPAAFTSEMSVPFNVFAENHHGRWLRIPPNTRGRGPKKSATSSR